MVFTETEWIAMPRAIARDVLRQEIGGNPNIEVTHELSEKIRAMIKSKKVEVISDLGLLAEAGKQSKLLSTQELIYPSSWTDPQIAEGITVGASPSAFSTREVGTVVGVTPEIQTDGTISMTPDIESMEVDANDYFTPDKQPVFSSRQLAPQINLKNGIGVILSGGEASESVKKAHPGEDWLLFVLFRATIYTP